MCLRTTLCITSDSNCFDTEDVRCSNDLNKRRANNNFVRIGRNSPAKRSSTNEEFVRIGRRESNDPDERDADKIDKRSKQAFVRIGRKASANFVRIGRPGFVRIGKSSPLDSNSPEISFDDEDGLMNVENN